jgi:LacI family transcriptional regulator
VEENEESTYHMVKYLLERGHKRISLINGSRHISTVLEREKGYHRAMSEMGVKVDIVYGKYDQKSGYRLTKEILTHRKERPTAIVCANNDIAIGVLLAIQNCGLSIPKDVSVVSFGEIPLQDLVEPKVTCVVQNPEKVGEVSGGILLKRVTGQGGDLPERVVLPTTFREGNSVKILG